MKGSGYRAPTNLQQLWYTTVLLCLLAVISNFGILFIYQKYEKKLDRFEERIKHKLPKDYSIKKSKFALGRYGYKPVILIFLVMWAMSFIYSYTKYEYVRLSLLDLPCTIRSSIELTIASITSITKI